MTHMDMTLRWRLKPHYSSHVIDGSRVLLLSERQPHQCLSGRLYTQLLPLLDGTHTAHDAATRLENTFPYEKTYFGLLSLHRRGYLDVASDGLTADAAAFWYGLGIDAAAAAAALRDTPVVLASMAVGTAEADTCADALVAGGVRIVAEQDAAFGVVVARNYDNVAVDAVADRLEARGIPWMPFAAGQGSTWIGPIVTAGSDTWRRVKAAIREGRFGASPPATSSTPSIAARLAAIEVITWIARGRRAGDRPSVLVYDSHSMETARYQV